MESFKTTENLFETHSSTVLILECNELSDLWSIKTLSVDSSRMQKHVDGNKLEDI